MSKRNDEYIYDENVDYDNLEKHEYPDAPGEVYYICPCCGGEYLPTFIISEDGKTMCIECWEKIK